MKRAAIEQYRVNTRTTPQEIGKVPSDRTIGRIGKPPLLQGGPVCGKDAPASCTRGRTIEQHRLDLSTRELSRTHRRDQAGPRPGNEIGKGSSGRPSLRALSPSDLATGDHHPTECPESLPRSPISRGSRRCAIARSTCRRPAGVVAHCLALDSGAELRCASAIR